MYREAQFGFPSPPPPPQRRLKHNGDSPQCTSESRLIRKCSPLSLPSLRVAPTPGDRLIRQPFVSHIVVRRVLSCNNVSFPLPTHIFRRYNLCRSSSLSIPFCACKPKSIYFQYTREHTTWIRTAVWKATNRTHTHTHTLSFRRCRRFYPPPSNPLIVLVLHAETSVRSPGSVNRLARFQPHPCLSATYRENRARPTKPFFPLVKYGRKTRCMFKTRKKCLIFQKKFIFDILKKLHTVIFNDSIMVI